MNKTKIIATVGVNSSDKETIKEMINAGADVLRINLEHTNEKNCVEIVNKINAINEEIGTNVAIMLDTKGSMVRTGKFLGGEAELVTGTKIRIYMEKIVGDATKFSVTYPSLIEEISYDAIIKINQGHVELRVEDKGKEDGVPYLLCKVLIGGTITDDTCLNFPETRLELPFLTAEDRKSIDLADKLNVDFLALSFVGTHDDVLEINDLLIDMGNNHIGIIAKIENERAFEDIDEIIKVADGVMIARGDLGSELPMERVPGMQKAIITKAHLAGKVSIVATELMASMEEELTPTRAEVSDVANAVLDGADAVMLAAETTIGKYPTETVATMDKIIATAELDVDYFNMMDRAMRTESKDTTGVLAHSVAYNSNLLDCKAIFAPTMSGYTARKISRFRPKCPIIAVSPDVNTVRSLALNFGVYPVLIDELKKKKKIIDVSKKMVKDVIDINQGDKIIITGGYPFKEVRHTNFMKIEEI